MMPTTLTSHDIPTRGADTIGSGVLVQRVRAEFEEMPGLVLTVAQASRLWGLTATESETLFKALVDDGFLVRDRRATYRRRGCPRCA